MYTGKDSYVCLDAPLPCASCFPSSKCIKKHLQFIQYILYILQSCTENVNPTHGQKSWGIFDTWLSHTYGMKQKQTKIHLHSPSAMYATFHVEHLSRTCSFSGVSTLYWRSYRGILMMCDKMILFSMKHEFRKLLFLICDLKVLRDLWRTWIINRYSWFYLWILHDFEMQVLQIVKSSID